MNEDGFSRVTIGLFTAGSVEMQSLLGILYRQPVSVVRKAIVHNMIFFKVTPRIRGVEDAAGYPKRQKCTIKF